MPKYHFDVGDSTSGPIGFCAVIEAASPQAAVERLREQLLDTSVRIEDAKDAEYIEVYFNDQKVSEADIDSVEDDEDSADAGQQAAIAGA
jgi:hypothetical protein